MSAPELTRREEPIDLFLLRSVLINLPVAWGDFFIVLGLVLDMAGAYLFLVASKFWQEEFAQKSRKLGWFFKLFDIVIPFVPFWAGLFLFLGFLFQFIGYFMK